MREARRKYQIEGGDQCHRGGGLKILVMGGDRSSWGGGTTPAWGRVPPHPPPILDNPVQVNQRNIQIGEVPSLCGTFVGPFVGRPVQSAGFLKMFGEKGTSDLCKKELWLQILNKSMV